MHFPKNHIYLTITEKKEARAYKKSIEDIPFKIREIIQETTSKKIYRHYLRLKEKLKADKLKEKDIADIRQYHKSFIKVSVSKFRKNDRKSYLKNSCRYIRKTKRKVENGLSKKLS